MHGREYIQAVLDDALAKLRAASVPAAAVDIYSAELDGGHVVVGYSGTIRPGHHPAAMDKRAEFYARLVAITRAYLDALGTANETAFAIAWAPLEREFAARDQLAWQASGKRDKPEKQAAHEIFLRLKERNGKPPTWKEVSRELEAQGLGVKDGTVRDWLRKFRQG